MALRSSRTLPGHAYEAIAARAAGEKPRTRRAQLGDEVREDALGEQADVVAALAKGGDAERDDGDAEEEIPPERVLIHHGGEIAVRRREDAGAEGDGLVRAEALEAAVLQRAEELRLAREAELADLVEQERAVPGGLEGALARRDGAREGPALRAEQLRFEQVLRDGGAVDHAERRLGARALLVDEARDEGLSDAALAEEERAGVGGGEARDDARDVLRRLRRAEEGAGAADGEGPQALRLRARRREHAHLLQPRSEDAGRHDEEPPELVREDLRSWNTDCDRRGGGDARGQNERRRAGRGLFEDGRRRLRGAGCGVERDVGRGRVERHLRRADVVRHEAPERFLGPRPIARVVERLGELKERGEAAHLGRRAVEERPNVRPLRPAGRNGARGRRPRSGALEGRVARGDAPRLALHDDEPRVADEERFAHLDARLADALGAVNEGRGPVGGADEQVAAVGARLQVPPRDGRIAKDKIVPAGAADGDHLLGRDGARARVGTFAHDEREGRHHAKTARCGRSVRSAVGGPAGFCEAAATPATTAAPATTATVVHSHQRV